VKIFIGIEPNLRENGGMTSFWHQFWRICACFWLGGLVVSCVDTSQMSRVTLVPETAITFFLIDNSLSYNNPADNASQRVMQMVRREIVAKLKQAQPGEHFIVRTIQAESDQLSAMITNLDLTQADLFFPKPRPTNPIELKVWEGEKRDFEASVQARTAPLIESAINEFEIRGQPIFAEPSKSTDFVGALLTCQRFFEKQKYDHKKLIIYSDMIEDAALEDDSQLQLSEVEIVARFVTKPSTQRPGHTHQYFKNLESNWRTKLAAPQFELYEVQNSF
jgi:hypothetical protein